LALNLFSLLDRIVGDISLDEENAILDQIRQLARDDWPSFLEAFYRLPVESDDPYEISPIAYVYEALSDEASKWGDFFLDELDRLVSLVHDGSNPTAVLALIDEFYLLGFDEDDPIYGRFRKKLVEYLQDLSAPIRGKCAALLDGFMDETDTVELALLEEILLTDADWRVRYHAAKTITEVSPQWGNRVKLPLTARLKAMLFDPNKWSG